jgi:hypothetical protein
MHPRRLQSRAALLCISSLALVLVAGNCGFPSPGPSVMAGALSPRGRTHERFETAGNVWGDFSNRFDPAQVRLDGEFIAPDGGTLVVPGFYTQGFTRALVGGNEKLTRRGKPHWRVRMTPTQPGSWQWRWVATTPHGSAATAWECFDVDPPAPDRHGFLRRSPLDGRYLRFDDGTPYVAIGENLGWYDARGTFAYDDWFAKLAAQGVNHVRLWMPSWAFGIEWITRAQDGSLASTSLGNYTERLDRAWQLDQVMEAAERHGIAVMLSIQNHGAFSLTSNSEWADSPYNAANGGPLDVPTAFFTDPTARELFQRRLRYLVARWGYATNLLAWELWNEVDLVGKGPSVETWHVEMANALRDLDPYDHLISTSRAQSALASYWGLPQIDFTQVHHYSFPFGLDLPDTVDHWMRSYGTAFPGKPRLLAEYGVDYRGPAETLALDPESIGFHQGLWIGLLAGGFGTGMSWWWDNLVDPQDLYFHFGPVASFVEGVAFDQQNFAVIRPPVAASDRNLAAYALRGTHVVLAWLQNVDHQWLLDPLPGPDATPVVGATLALTDLANGAWTARWIDTYTGIDIATDAAQVTDGTITLAVPTFSKDVALRMER